MCGYNMLYLYLIENKSHLQGIVEVAYYDWIAKKNQYFLNINSIHVMLIISSKFVPKMMTSMFHNLLSSLTFSY